MKNPHIRFCMEWRRAGKKWQNIQIPVFFALDGITAADEEHKSFLRELLMSLVEREK